MDIKVNGGSRPMLQQLNKEGPKAGPSRKPQPRVRDPTTGKNTQKTTNRKVQKTFMSNNSKGKDKAQESLIKGMNNKEVGNNRMTGSSNDEENKKKDGSMKKTVPTNYDPKGSTDEALLAVMRNMEALISMFATRFHYDKMDMVFNANKPANLVDKESLSNNTFNTPREEAMSGVIQEVVSP